MRERENSSRFWERGRRSSRFLEDEEQQGRLREGAARERSSGNSAERLREGAATVAVQSSSSSVEG